LTNLFDPAPLACLDRIRDLDPHIRAWVRVDPQPPLAEGPLSGIAFGVKDIFDTAALATEWGSALMAGRTTPADSVLVRDLRLRGGVMLGKTHTTSFAYFDPSPTRNPRAHDRTPGGSSSGSAAAVAAGMVPFAIGSQTQGSVLRPASYCGCVGFKPTIGVLPLEGVMPFAPTLDTAGLFTRTAAEMEDLWERMGHATAREGATKLAALRMPDQVEPEMRHKFLEIVAHLGVPIVDPPDPLDRLFDKVALVQEVEGARTHGDTWRRHGAAMGAKLSALIERGLAVGERHYRDCLDGLRSARERMAALFDDYPVLLSPAALGPPPAISMGSTGSPLMNGPWTGLGAPAISIPMPVGQGLPLGLQLAAAPGNDALLLATARALDNGWS
jgi:Asp-tRNA(Asn)/Glu-tRNA(Gln) amidotransferase A subunit family amidase